MRNEGDERTFSRRNNNLTSKGRGASLTRKLEGEEGREVGGFLEKEKNIS